MKMTIVLIVIITHAITIDYPSLPFAGFFEHVISDYVSSIRPMIFFTVQFLECQKMA